MIFDDLDDALRAFEAASPQGGTDMNKKRKAAERAGRADPPAAKKARNKAYEKELARLQVEIANLQAWVKASGARIVIIFEGRDAAGKGGMIKRLDRARQPARLPRRGAARALGPAEDADLHAALHRAAARRRRGADLRPQLVQPPRRRARHGLLHRRGRQALPAGDPAPRGAADRVGHHAAQVLPDRRRGGAGAPLPPAHRRSGAPVEALADGPRVLPPLVGLYRAPTTR